MHVMHVSLHAGSLQGEPLLCSAYLAGIDEAQEQAQMMRSSMASLTQFGLGAGGGRAPYGGVEMARLVVRPWATSGPASPPVGGGGAGSRFGGVHQAHLIRPSIAAASAEGGVGDSLVYTSFATSAVDESYAAFKGGLGGGGRVAASQAYTSFADSAASAILPGEDSGLMSGSVVYSSVGGGRSQWPTGAAARASVAASVQALGPIPPTRPMTPSSMAAVGEESFGAPPPPPPPPPEPPLDPAVVARNKAEAAANKLRWAAHCHRFFCHIPELQSMISNISFHSAR